MKTILSLSHRFVTNNCFRFFFIFISLSIPLFASPHSDEERQDSLSEKKKPTLSKVIEIQNHHQTQKSTTKIKEMKNRLKSPGKDSLVLIKDEKKQKKQQNKQAMKKITRKIDLQNVMKNRYMDMQKIQERKAKQSEKDTKKEEKVRSSHIQNTKRNQLVQRQGRIHQLEHDKKEQKNDVHRETPAKAPAEQKQESNDIGKTIMGIVAIAAVLGVFLLGEKAHKKSSKDEEK